MKKVLLSVVLFALALINVSAQLDCNQDYSNTLDANGEAQMSILDLVPNIEFMLTQGTVTYYVFPLTTGEITSSTDSISLTCENRGLPTFIVEVTVGDELIENCTATLVITSPNGGCPGGNPDLCEGDSDCTKVVSGFTIIGDTDIEIFATDIALCEDAIGCDGSYSIAYGLASNGTQLTFGNSISSADATQFVNPITIFYSDASTTVFVQSYLYVWSNAECILKADYKTTYELDLTAETQITPENFLSGDEMCDSVVIAMTELDADEPDNFQNIINVDCNDLGRKRIWVRHTETGFTLSKIVQILDPLEACGTVLGAGDVLISTMGFQGLFFNTDIEINGTLLPRHPGGIGWILNEDNLVDGPNTIQFITDDFSLNGISTLDLVLGLRIILLDEYDDPKESVLFDVDQSGYNGIGDLITMRELILGISNGDGISDAYFFNNSYMFPSDFNPFDFDNTFTQFTFDKADFATTDFSFAAYKVGDLNETVIPGFTEKAVSETRSAVPSYLVSDMAISEGETFTFDLKYESEAKFKGLLAALIGDGIEFVELEDAGSEVQYNIINPNEIRISYINQSAEAELDNITFKIKAVTTKSGELVDLLGLKAGFPQEVVDENNNVIIINDIETLIISSINIDGLNTEVKLYPNPAHNNITLLSADAELQAVNIIDALGRSIMTTNLNGNNETLDISNLINGLYHITITTEGGLQAATFIKE